MAFQKLSRPETYFFINLETEEHDKFAKVYLDERSCLIVLQFGFSVFPIEGQFVIFYKKIMICDCASMGKNLY